MQVTQQRPTSLEDLQRIQGIGPGKAGDYGAEIIALIEAQPPRVDDVS